MNKRRNVNKESVIPSNHMIGCDLEAYANILDYRGYKGEGNALRQIAAVIK